MFLMACDDDSSSSGAPTGPETDVVIESSSSSETENLSSSEKSKAKSSSSSEAEKISSSEKSKEKSSSSEELTSSSSETDALSSSSEDMEDSSSSESPESSSSEALLKKIANIEVRAFHYIFMDMDFLRLSIANNEDHDLDSLTIGLFFTAKPEQVENCATLIDHDLCQMFDKDGFDTLCINDREMRDLMRHALPVRIESSYDSVSGTYSYYYPVSLGSAMIKPQSRISIDLGFSSGISNDNYMTCETLRMPGKKRFDKDPGDWSWHPHALEEGAYYAGMPFDSRDYGGAIENIPINPYIFVFRKDMKDGFLWGYSPIDSLIGL